MFYEISLQKRKTVFCVWIWPRNVPDVLYIGINKSRKSFVDKFWVTEKCGFLEVRGLQKKLRSESQSESKGPHCYGLCSHVPAGLPRGEVTERSEDHGEGKGPHRYGPCSPSLVCASPWAKCGRGDTTFRPDFFIDRYKLYDYIRSTWYLMINYVTNFRRKGL